jgi:hypothetical protein
MANSTFEKDRPNDKIDLVAIELFLNFIHCAFGFQLLANDDHFGVKPANFATQCLQRQLTSTAAYQDEVRWANLEPFLGGCRPGKGRSAAKPARSFFPLFRTSSEIERFKSFGRHGPVRQRR